MVEVRLLVRCTEHGETASSPGGTIVAVLHPTEVGVFDLDTSQVSCFAGENCVLSWSIMTRDDHGPEREIPNLEAVGNGDGV